MEIIHQNYKDHIKAIHPTADENDLRTLSQSSSLSFYSPSSESTTSSSEILSQSINTEPAEKCTAESFDLTSDKNSIDIKLEKILEKLENIELKVDHNGEDCLNCKMKERVSETELEAKINSKST